MSLENSASRDVLAHYGPRSTLEKYGGEASNGGKVKTAVYKFSYDGLPVNGDTGLHYVVPAGAIIKDVWISSPTAFVGGTSYDIGLEEADGSTIDLDGLFDALLLAELNLGASARTHTGTNSGALLDLEVTAAAQLIVVATGTFTAGVAELVIEYVD